MKIVSFATAVLAAVQGYRVSGTEFSAYDVTKKLRDDANAGLLEFTDLDKRDVDGSGTEVYPVDHQRVRALISEWSSNGLLNDFDKGVGYSGGNSYITYKPKPTTLAVTDGATGASTFNQPIVVAGVQTRISSVASNAQIQPFLGGGNSSAVGINTKTVNTNNVAANPLLNSGYWIDKNKVLTYINNKNAKGAKPTLKGIQSRLKINGTTVDDIANVVKSLGYQISPQPGLKASLSVVHQ